MAKEQPIGVQLTDLLGRVSKDDLAAVEASIAEKNQAIDEATAKLRADLANLKQARKLIAARLGIKLREPTGRRRKANGGGEPQTNGRVESAPQSGGVIAQRRVEVAKLLMQRGPLASSAIANELEIPQGSITAVLSCGYFDRGPRGFTLSNTGRSDLLKLAAKDED